MGVCPSVPSPQQYLSLLVYFRLNVIQRYGEQEQSSIQAERWGGEGLWRWASGSVEPPLSSFLQCRTVQSAAVLLLPVTETHPGDAQDIFLIFFPTSSPSFVVPGSLTRRSCRDLDTLAHFMFTGQPAWWSDLISLILTCPKPFPSLLCSLADCSTTVLFVIYI